MARLLFTDPNAPIQNEEHDVTGEALYMLLANGEVRAAESPGPAIAWCERSALPLDDAEAFWVYLGRTEGRDRYAAVRIGDARASEALAFQPARQAGFLNLFQLARSSSVEQQHAARAAHLGTWLHRSRYCGMCGHESAYLTDLNKRVCSNQDCRFETYPRIEPAVIVLVVEGTRCMLAREGAFPKGYFAPIAGFVEAGETPEQAVRREVFEEAGLVVNKMAYVAAQPWPFPSSLMLGYIAHVAPGQEIRLSGELAEALWVDRGELGEVIARSAKDRPLLLPPSGVIGRALIDEWLVRAATQKSHLKGG
jgi:NAD+ diphosphatase